MDADDRVTVICCAEVSDPAWRWVESYFVDTNVRFEFVRCIPRRFDRVFKVFNLTRLRGCWNAVQIARRYPDRLIVTHGPTLAAWCVFFARISRVRIRLLAHSFNFSVLPGPVKRCIFEFAFSSVDRFVVFSQAELDLYSRAFNIPLDRFDFVHWGVNVPRIEVLDQPVVKGRYVAAIGGNSRDYRTLIEAAWKLSDVRFVLVVRPRNLKGLLLPANVTVHTNISLDKSMDILRHAQLMVLPLASGEVPCGHVTLVAAMHLGKAMVVTDSTGVSDYVRDRDNALLVQAKSAKGLESAISLLWQNGELCAQLGASGRAFAATYCTEENIARHFQRYLNQ
jgi:glycosyltransferase involved in cell wall biosynthesis